MKVSMTGINLIKKYEGLRLVSYKCTSGYWTIGYGHTSNVTSGQIINEDIANQLLSKDVSFAEHAVNKHVKVTISQNQFDALVSLSFNIGEGALSDSTLLRLLNSGDILGSANQFTKWIFSGGSIVKGLQKRREEEKSLFLS